MRPIHPGEVLEKEFLEPLSLTATALAKALSVSLPSVNDIVLQRGGVSADMALRLSIRLDTTPEFWLNLQSTYELRNAEIGRGGCNPGSSRTTAAPSLMITEPTQFCEITPNL
jgi:addiction module HigA family antidote